METVHYIEKMNMEMRSPYNDGFTQLHYKNKLLLIKEAVDKALNNAPVFADEEHYIERYRTK